MPPMPPAPVSGGGYRTPNSSDFTVFNGSQPSGSHYRTFFDPHRTIGWANDPTLGFNPTGPVPFQYYGEPPGPTQNAPPGCYTNPRLSFSGSGHTVIGGFDSQGYESYNNTVSTGSETAVYSCSGHDQAAQNLTSSPGYLQSQVAPQTHRQETIVQQLASAICMGIELKTYQKLYGKPVDDPESKENNRASLSLSGPTIHRGLCVGEPPKGIGSGTITISSQKPRASDRMAARDLGHGSEDVECRLGSLMIQEASWNAIHPNQVDEARPIQSRARTYNESANVQKAPLTNWPSIGDHDSNAEDKPPQTSKLATSGGLNPTTPTRRRPNQAQRRQLKRQSDLLGTFRPTTAVVPQTSQGQYLRGNNSPRQPPPLSVPQEYSHHDSSPTSHGASHPHMPINRGQQQILPHTQQAHFSGASPIHHLQPLQRKPPGIKGPHQPAMSAQIGPRQHQQLQQQRGPGRLPADLETIKNQSDFLDEVAKVEVAKAEVSQQEVAEKELFRSSLEDTCRDVISQHEASKSGGHVFDPNSIRLECFGSLSSGFATKSSDMDLALLSPLSQPPLSSSVSPIPRLLEKRLLDLGLGARFLTKTRVPIMKLCEKPTAELLALLRKARGRWEAGEENTTMGERDTDGVLALSPSRDVGRVQRTGHNDNEDSTDIMRHDDPDSQDSNEPRSPTHDLKSLEQKPEETFWAYNSRARRLLKLIGGRDITFRHENLKSTDLQLLSTAVEGFVNGIRDDSIRQAVKAALPKNSVISLYGVWLLAEGERLIGGWDALKIHEITGEHEAQGYKLIREWRQLQNREGMELSHYNEELRKLLEQMQQLPSLRLLSLSQHQHEPIEMYNARAIAVLEELGGTDCEVGNWEDQLSAAQRALLELTIHLYIEGVYDTTLRKAVRRTSSRRSVSLADVSSIHRAELSIQKYESGISMGLYSNEEQEILKEHAQLVRLYGLRSGHEDVCAVLDKMKSLPDPSPPPRQRDFADSLEFPKTGVGIQCDINFSNLLALYNTTLLRCYSHSDSRVRPMAIFVKAWAKKRRINSPYHGTLSSYGYVLMVMHYLLNVASPPVLINLQHAWKFSEREFLLGGGLCEGYDIRFWCDEEEIKRQASLGQITRNTQHIGALLRGFFEYYSHQGAHVAKNGFVWNSNAISIRTPGGLLPKQAKGWTEARTVAVGGKEVRQRYLLAIEDPFETDHNVGRTVTYHGISSIRDEFRRAWRIINAIGRDHGFQEGLFDEAVEVKGRGEKSVRDNPTGPETQGTESSARDQW
ncbi:hypothetical protein GP486_005235 [Trichoglossum hirsutum]|uniref:polynucleotide adenylyltransferase n=1 Tax=Trichoglossum hirsutum TaxID=265104 RepID=A0A9P8RN29_9PEZI|nr:hypothetical protein GP486_005235 [Trichoglossum hirsutum]